MPTHHHHRHHRHNATGNHQSPPKPSPKLLSIVLKFIVMSLILSLFLLFIGLAAIVLLHLLLAGSFLHRRRRRLLRRPLSPPPSSSSLSLHDIHTQIPPVQFQTLTPNSPDCSICLEFFNHGDICRVLPVCDHVFHARCVDRWLTKVPNCPICRTRVRLAPAGSPHSVDGDDDSKFLWAIGVGR